jgi:hypothetical protein
MTRTSKSCQWLTIVLLLAWPVACKKMPFFAGTGATLVISADRSFLKTGGDRAMVTVMGFNEVGEPLHDHTQVVFTATLGTIPAAVEMMEGRATVEFLSGGKGGVAVITARSGNIVASPAPLTIAIGSGALDTLTIQADPATLGPRGGQSLISVYAFDASMNLLVDIPVILSASAGELQGGNTVRFTDQNGRISEYLYTTEGATVRAESGSKSAEIEVTVDENQLPSAVFSKSPDSVKVGETVYFNGGLSSDLDGRVVNWEWNFGDGATARGEKANHVYAKAGTYTVTLKITDDDGGSNACEETVTITE